ncbi:hypothetical protein D3C86_2047070 [compost metagenome]
MPLELFYRKEPVVPSRLRLVGAEVFEFVDCSDLKTRFTAGFTDHQHDRTHGRVVGAGVDPERVPFRLAIFLR